MLGLFSREPRTHYDGNDPHGYKMNDVLDPPQLGGLVDELERENVLYINGQRYSMFMYSGPDEHGVVKAWLKPASGWEIPELSKEPVNLEESPF